MRFHSILSKYKNSENFFNDVITNELSDCLLDHDSVTDFGGRIIPRIPSLCIPFRLKAKIDWKASKNIRLGDTGGAGDIAPNPEPFLTNFYWGGQMMKRDPISGEC